MRDCGDARGFGLFACRNFKAGALIGEYVGEVMRARNYAQLRRERKEKHWYFMALDKEEVVDASRRGGLTRFLNHSCEPNAECQSWTVVFCVEINQCVECTVDRAGSVERRGSASPRSSRCRVNGGGRRDDSARTRRDDFHTGGWGLTFDAQLPKPRPRGHVRLQLEGRPGQVRKSARRRRRPPNVFVAPRSVGGFWGTGLKIFLLHWRRRRRMREAVFSAEAAAGPMR